MFTIVIFIMVVVGFILTPYQLFKLFKFYHTPFRRLVFIPAINYIPLILFINKRKTLIIFPITDLIIMILLLTTTKHHHTVTTFPLPLLVVDFLLGVQIFVKIIIVFYLTTWWKEFLRRLNSPTQFAVIPVLMYIVGSVEFYINTLPIFIHSFVYQGSPLQLVYAVFELLVVIIYFGFAYWLKKSVIQSHTTA